MNLLCPDFRVLIGWYVLLFVLESDSNSIRILCFDTVRGNYIAKRMMTSL